MQIHIFSDRLEISNPGGLVGGMELKDLGKRSVPRNPLIFGMLYRMNLVEHVGSGIKRIKEALAEDGLPEPVLEVDEHWFSITFVRASLQLEQPTVKMSEKTSEKILHLIAPNSSITISELSATLDVAARTIERNIEKLRVQHRIRQVGPDKGGHWEVVD